MMLKKTLPMIALLSLMSNTSCSLKPSERSTGFNIQLKPLSVESELSLLAAPVPFTLLGSVTGLSQLNCFLVNAYNGAIGSNSICGGLINEGIHQGFISGINSVFSLFIPVGDGTVFEAFGAAGTCVDVKSAGSNTGSVYRLGSLVTQAGDLGRTVSIPVSVNANTPTINCNSSTPYPFLTENFDGYGSGAGPLESVPGSIWTKNFGASYTYSGSPNFNLQLASVTPGYTPATTVAFDKPYYSVSASFKLTSVGGSGAGFYDLSLGFADGTAVISNSLGCTLHITTSVATISGGSIEAGSGAGTVFPSTASNAITYTAGDLLNITCEIFNVAGTLKVVATAANQTSATTVVTPATGLTNNCTSGICGHPYFAAQKGADPTSFNATLDGLVYSQADAPQ